nr:nucleoside triphosphate pyrophosphohydrolase [uncultured Prevotella sp.]
MHTKEEKIKAFKRLLDIQERLRKECPWDKKQTFESLRPNTIEETFELAQALINQDYKNICKELGDLMEHIIFYSLLGSEIEKFDVADVCNAQSDKLMFRHDFIDWRGWHLTDKDMTINTEGRVVYKDELIQKHNGSIPNKAPTTANQVESTWEQRKQMERNGNKTVLSGVPDALPSIIKAYRIQDKARNVGFDWKQKEDVWEKVEEELQELKQELSKDDKENSTKELGDFLFSVINAARLYKLNPDNALEQTCQKFISRFSYVEKQSKKMGKYLKDMTLFEMDKLWNEAKSLERHEL